MAGEGLFFTGQVLKNNRNLLQEEAVREQLRLRREQLDLQKQRIADQRAEARRRREKPKDYSFESIENRFVPSFSNRILNLRNLAGENPDNSNLINTETLNIDTEQQVLKGITSQYQSLVELSRQGKDKNFIRNDQGGYVYEDNLNAISEGYANGQNLNDLMLMYPLNYDDIADVTIFQNPIGSRVSDFIKDQKVLPEVNNFKVPFSSGIQEKTKSYILQNSTPNPDGSFDDPNFEMMMVGGQNVDFINSGPADPRFMFGISKGYSDVGESFYNKINPKSGEGVYDPELYKEYQDFFVDEMIKLEKAKNPLVPIYRASSDDKSEKISERFINIFNTPAETENIGGVNVKIGSDFRVAGPASTRPEGGQFIPVSFNQVMGVESKGRVKDATADLKENPEATIDGRIVGVGQDENNRGIVILQSGPEDDSFRFVVPIQVAEQAIVKNYKDGSFARELLKYDIGLQNPGIGEGDILFQD
tara:strand:- start:9732 stop:11159 length:1428 start_codon:yes stop_codon:yes gene_type:complete